MNWTLQLVLVYDYILCEKKYVCFVKCVFGWMCVLVECFVNVFYYSDQQYISFIMQFG